MASALATVIFVSSNAVGMLHDNEMEKVYWDCEFAATRGRISLDDAAACNEVYERLKKLKFDGRFERFFVWWQENKARELSARAAGEQVRDD